MSEMAWLDWERQNEGPEGEEERIAFCRCGCGAWAKEGDCIRCVRTACRFCGEWHLSPHCPAFIDDNAGEED